MTLIEELQQHYALFHDRICLDGHADILNMPYAEFSLQCFLIYQDFIENTLLGEQSSLRAAFRMIDITLPRDQMVIFIETFYLSRRIKEDVLH